MADVLIVGGGVAGSALAIQFGRQGLEVELVEKRIFPREKPCGEGIMPAGVAVLEQLGLAQAVGGERFRGVRYHVDEDCVEGRFPRVDGFPRCGIAQRRYRLDQVLFDAAAATNGVSARTGACVEELVRKNGRVAGALIDGQRRMSGLVIGADGAHSRVRSLLGWNTQPAEKRIGARAHFRLADGQAQAPWVNVILLPGVELYVTPLPEREVGVAALTTGLRGSLEASFLQWRKASPFLTSYLDGAAQTTELLATSPLSQRARAGSAPGIVLLGDAAGSTDPITGGGMAQALLCAMLLSRHLERERAGGWEWLAQFERDRRELLKDYQRLTAWMLRFSRRHSLAAFALRRLERAPELLSHLMGVAGGLRPLWGGRSAAERLLPGLATS